MDDSSKIAEIRSHLLDRKLETWTSVLIEAGKILMSWLIVLLILPFLAIFYLYRFSMQTVAQVLDTELRPISPSDVPFAIDKLAEQDTIDHKYERNPLNTIGLYMNCGKGKTNIPEFTQRIQEQILDTGMDWNWKLKCYLVRFCGYSFWKPVPNTRAVNHVKHARLIPGESVRGFMSSWIRKPFPPKTSLWEFMILDAGEEEVTAFKIHHSLGDGLSINAIINPIFEISNHPLVQRVLDHPPLQWSFLEKMKLILRIPLLFINTLSVVLMSSDPFKLDLRREVNQWLSRASINFSELKEISKRRGIALNTVLLAIYSGALRRFLHNRDCGNPIPKDLLIPMALPWPGRPKNFIGNHWNTMFASVPINISDPLQRMDEIQSKMSSQLLGNLVFTPIIAHLLALLPLNLHLYFRRIIRVSYTLSSFVAADSYTSYDGRSPESINAVASLVFPSLGTMTLTISFKNQFIWTVVGDRTLFKTQKDLDIFTEKYILEEFEELLSSARSK